MVTKWFLWIFHGYYQNINNGTQELVNSPNLFKYWGRISHRLILKSFLTQFLLLTYLSDIKMRLTNVLTPIGHITIILKSDLSDKKNEISSKQQR